MIKMSPAEAEKSKNHLKVREAMDIYYRKAYYNRVKPKYKVGDIVRVVSVFFINLIKITI